MAWQAIDRRTAVMEEGAAPVLSEALREKIRSFFPRYETKRAALLPALHVVQDALGHVGYPAMKEVAEVLEISPSDVLDTLSFYTHYWDHPKGKKVIVACRSLSCHLMGSEAVLDAVKAELGVEEHGTTKDGAYSLMTEECLAACDFGPCLLVGERLHKCVKPDDVKKILKDAKNAEITAPRSDLFDAPSAKAATAKATGAGKETELGNAVSSGKAAEPGRAVGVGKAAAEDDGLGTTSDVSEMKGA